MFYCLYLQRFQPSRSVDELNDRRERVDTGRVAKTPDISLDDRRQKHVSFDNGSMVRSNTVGGGLEEVGGDFRGGPVATSTPLNSQRRAFSPPPRRNRSQERLLDGFITARPPSEFSDRPSSVASTSRYVDICSGNSTFFHSSFVSLLEIKIFFIRSLFVYYLFIDLCSFIFELLFNYLTDLPVCRTGNKSLLDPSLNHLRCGGIYFIALNLNRIRTKNF